jgi:hypothetical protein
VPPAAAALVGSGDIAALLTVRLKMPMRQVCHQII